MKRNATEDETTLLHRIDINIDVSSYPSKKIIKHVPSNLIPNATAHRVSKVSSKIFQDISGEDTVMVETKIENRRIDSPRFVFFLGVQGKEYIECIRKHFESLTIEPLIITCNIDDSMTSTNSQCVKLSTEFNVLDPLGGGLYPLDYLFIIDGNERIRCAVPLVVNKNMHQLKLKNKGGEVKHARFGLQLGELGGLVEEYYHYFTSTER